MGPREPRSTVLSKEEEALIVAFRKHTLLPLDDCLYALQATVPHLTRSSLHRCFQRHGISRLPETQGDKPAKKKFKSYPIGYFHIDIAEVRTEEGKLYLFVAIDRTSKFAYGELHEKANRWIATDFLKALIKAVPYKIHTVLTNSFFCSLLLVEYVLLKALKIDFAASGSRGRRAISSSVSRGGPPMSRWISVSSKTIPRATPASKSYVRRSIHAIFSKWLNMCAHLFRRSPSRFTLRAAHGNGPPTVSRHVFSAARYSAFRSAGRRGRAACSRRSAA